jgi:hypothetical protein
LLALLVGVSPLHAQGVLERMRLATHEGPHPPPSPPAPTTSTTPNAWAGLGTGAAEGMGYGVVGLAVAATSPFWIPHYLLGDDLEVPGYFPACPYGLDWAGYMNMDYNGLHSADEQQAHFGDPDYQKTWAVRLSVEDGNDFQGLNRLDGQVFFDTTSRLGLRSHWSQFQENVDGRTDESLLGDTELTYRFVQREWLQMHTGLGVRLLTDRSDTRVGFNFFYGADVYPLAPLVLSTSLDLGNLDAAFVLHGRLTAGVAWRNWELLTGYDFLRIGSVNLQGPLLGLRCWF